MDLCDPRKTGLKRQGPIGKTARGITNTATLEKGSQVSAKEVSLFAYLTVKEGSEELFKQRLANLVQRVRSEEEGCLRYELYRRSDNPREYVVVEKYCDQQALDLHNAGLVQKFGEPAPGEGLPRASSPAG